MCEGVRNNEAGSSATSQRHYYASRPYKRESYADVEESAQADRNTSNVRARCRITALRKTRTLCISERKTTHHTKTRSNYTMRI